jgi:hypothetical protein
LDIEKEAHGGKEPEAGQLSPDELRNLEHYGSVFDFTVTPKAKWKKRRKQPERPEKEDSGAGASPKRIPSFILPDDFLTPESEGAKAEALARAWAEPVRKGGRTRKPPDRLGYEDNEEQDEDRSPARFGQDKEKVLHSPPRAASTPITGRSPITPRIMRMPEKRPAEEEEAATPAPGFPKTYPRMVHSGKKEKKSPPRSPEKSPKKKKKNRPKGPNNSRDTSTDSDNDEGQGGDPDYKPRK